MKILIVDDDFTSRKILVGSLKDYGSCDLACNGDEAVIAYQQALEEGSPYQLILLDIMMPGMEGTEVLKRIRTEEDKRHIYGTDRVRIAMATCLNDKDHIIGSFHSGCDGYLLKPYSPTSIHRDLKKHGLIQ